MQLTFPGLFLLACLSILLIPADKSSAQCPFQVDLSADGVCPGSKLTISSQNPLSTIEWYDQDGKLVGKAASFPDYGSGITVAGGGGYGNADNQLRMVQGIWGDAAGNLYVCDPISNRIMRWAPGAASGVMVAGNVNGAGAQADELRGPSSVFVDANGNLYIADYGNFRIMKWAHGASSGVLVAGGNGQGDGPHQFHYPIGVFVDAAGNIYVADNNNHRVQKWAPGAAAGITVAGGNGAGTADDQLNSPRAVFVDANNNLYAVDTYNNCVKRFAPGDRHGVIVAGGNGLGAAANQLANPCGIFVDAAGTIFIADTRNNRVQKWTAGATSGETVAGGIPPGNGPDQFYEPVYVWVDGQNNLYVSDQLNSRVQKFPMQTTIDSVYTALLPGDYTAVVTDQKGCIVTSNKVTITEPPVTHISVSDNPVCAGTMVRFQAAPPAVIDPVYEWIVNDIGTGAGSPVYAANKFSDGDKVYCRLTSVGSCASISNTITMKVHQLPVIAPNQEFGSKGEGVLLQPVVSGDIVEWAWSPPTGLSADNTATPFANPLKQTVYRLTVTSVEGCVGNGMITVKVYREVRIPGAFTPNGDGTNDVFYVLGGPEGSQIMELAVYNRLGARVFQIHHVPPGDPAYGWNGYHGGHPAPAGTYVYMLRVRLSDGRVDNYKGTIVLVR